MRYLTTKPITVGAGALIRIPLNVAARFRGSLEDVGDGFLRTLAPINLKVGVLVEFAEEPDKGLHLWLEPELESEPKPEPDSDQAKEPEPKPEPDSDQAKEPEPEAGGRKKKR